MKFRAKAKPLSAAQERMAERLATRILSVQRKTADYLNNRTAEVSAKTWTIVLLAFCLIAGVFFTYLLIQAFKN